MNHLQLYRQIASEVFTRCNRDKDSLELFILRTFIDNINNERVENKKDAREEFKTAKKNVKSEALKQIVKDSEQALFGYDDDKSNEELEAEELDRRFNKLKNKKILEAEELDRKSENLKNRRLVKERIDALRQKLKYLNKARRNKSGSSETSSDSENNGDDEDDKNVINLNNISFDDLLNNPNMTPKIAEEIGEYFLKMANKKRKKDSGNNGDDDYDINPNIKTNVENILGDDSITPEYLEELSQNFFKLANEMRSKDNEDDSENNRKNGNNNGNNEDDSENNGNNNENNEDDSENNGNNRNNNGNNGNNNRNNGNNNRNNIENINTNLKKGSGMFTSQKEFAKLLNLLAQLHAGNNSKKLKNYTNQLLKSLYNSKQISELVYENLIAAI